MATRSYKVELPLDIVKRYLSCSYKSLLRTILLISVPCMIVIVIMNMMLSENFIQEGQPVLTVTGKHTNDTLIQYAQIPKAVIERTGKAAEGNADLYPFSYFNLQNIYLFKAFVWLRLSILVVPDEFVKERLSPYIENSSQTNPGCIIGQMASKQWELGVGDSFGLRLGDNFAFNWEKENRHENALPEFRITAKLSKKLDYQFFQGGIIIPESIARKMFNRDFIKNGIFVFKKKGGSYSKLRDIYIAEQLRLLIKREPLKENVLWGVCLLGLFSWIGYNFYFVISFLFKEYLPTLGVLSSLGMSKKRNCMIFVLIVAIYETVGILLGNMMAVAIILAVNQWIRIQSPYKFYHFHFRLHFIPFGILVFVAFLIGLAFLWYSMHLCRKSSPEDLIRKGTI